MVVCIVLCLVFAAAFLYLEAKGKYVPAVVLKGAASLCFVLLGILYSPGTQLAKLIITGLILGCAADVLLNLRLVFREKGQLIFLVGILVFLSGHILYLAANFPLAGNALICVAAGVVLTALLMVWILRQITAKTVFKIFGVFYIGSVVLLNCVTFAIMTADPGQYSIRFFIGALLFLASDVVLILNTFGPEQKQSLRITNIGLYYLGQILIALSVPYAAAVL